MWHIIKYRLYNSNKKRKLDSAILQVSSNFLSLPLLTPYQSVVFHVHIGKRFQFRNELLDFFLGRLWQYNSPARVSSYVHQLGAASSDKRHHFFMVKLHQRFCRYHCGASKPCYLFHSFHPFLNSWSFVHYLRIETVGLNGRAEYHTFHNRMVDELQKSLGVLGLQQVSVGQ